MVLYKRELEAGDFVLVITAVQIDRQRRALILYVVDTVSQRRDLRVVGVGQADIHPVEGTVLLVVQNLPVYVVGHLQGGVLLHIHSDQKVFDLIGRTVCPDCHCED